MTRVGIDVTANQTLWDLVARWANSRPDQECLVYMTEQDRLEAMVKLSWERIASTVWELRQRLAAAGVTDQRAVILALPCSPFTLVSLIATASNGAVAQAIDPEGGTLVLERAMLATEPVAVIGCRQNAAVLASAMRNIGCDSKLIVADDLSLTRPLNEIEGLSKRIPGDPPEATAEMVAGMLPTSGTSGSPKLVELTHRNYVTSGERLARNSGYTDRDRFYLCSPFFHATAQMYSSMPALVTGGSIAVVPRFSATRYFDAARRMGATVSAMVAPPMRMALHRASERGTGVDPGSLRLIQYGMTMSAADWKAWDELVPGIEMRQIYGQTESVCAVLGGAPWEVDDRRSIGRPFLGVEAVRLVGKDGTDVDDGASGELWVRGEPGRTLMRGYYRDAAATAATIDEEGWLRTGDIMVREPNGRFIFQGRQMHIIRRGGENISTYELELMMQACPLVEDVAIKAESDNVLDAHIAVHVIPADGFDEEGFLAWCREAIGRRGVPDVLRVHSSFPRTASGRVIVRDL